VPLYEGVQHLKKTGDAIQYGGPHLCENGNFPTPDGKAHFRCVELPAGAAGNAPGKFKATTRRGKQFNTLVYAEIDPINGTPRDAVLMNPDDAAALHLMQGDRVALTNNIGRYPARVYLAPIARGNLQIHWPEGNVIIRWGVTEPLSYVPDYSAQVTVEKIT
jgi:anaerobic selenocysteine-containing dehydrogenase